MNILLDVDPKLRIENLHDVFRMPKVIRVNHFDEEGLEDFDKDMDVAHRTGQPIIPVIVDSFGGSAYSVMGMVATIESALRPVATIVTSKAMSAGFILFCFGTQGYRFMHPDAILMLHELSSWTEGKLSDIQNVSKHLDKVNKTVMRKAARHLGHKSNYFLDLINSHKHLDWFMTAKEALGHNIANHLRVPRFEVKIGVDIAFV